MTLEELEQQLMQIAVSRDEVFSFAAQQIQVLVASAKSGELSSAELKEILEDQQRQLAIIDDMSELQFKEQLNTILTGLITIASAV